MASTPRHAGARGHLGGALPNTCCGSSRSRTLVAVQTVSNTCRGCSQALLGHPAVAVEFASVITAYAGAAEQVTTAPVFTPPRGS